MLENYLNDLYYENLLNHDKI